MTSTLVFAKRSICPCGFSVLKDEIPLGRSYDAAVALAVVVVIAVAVVVGAYGYKFYKDVMRMKR